MVDAVNNHAPRRLRVIIRWLREHDILSIATAISILALIVGINSMYTSWKGLEIDKLALDLAHKELEAALLSNSYAYYGYMASLVQVRVQLMELCALNLTIYESTCELIQGWAYLPWVYENYHPDRPYIPSPAANNATTPNVNLPAPAVAFITMGSVAGASAIAGVLIAHFGKRLA